MNPLYHPFKRTFLCAGIAIALSWFSTGRAAQGYSLIKRPAPRYVMEYLGTLPGNPSTRAVRINNRNQVIGRSIFYGSDKGAQEAAFFWENGVIKDLDLSPGAHTSRALDINDRGQIAGYAINYPDWVSPNPPTGIVWWDTWSLNNRGVVAGTVRGFREGPNHIFQAAIFKEGRTTVLPPVVRGRSTQFLDMNDYGELLLAAEVSDWAVHPVLRSGSRNIDLGALPGVQMKEAVALNNHGHVAGYTLVHEGDSTAMHPCLYRDGRAWDLALLPGTHSRYGYATALNDNDQVVGKDGGFFLYSEGVMYKLNDLISNLDPEWQLDKISAINNNGWMVGYVIPRDQNLDEERAIVLRPVR